MRWERRKKAMKRMEKENNEVRGRRWKRYEKTHRR